MDTGKPPTELPEDEDKQVSPGPDGVQEPRADREEAEEGQPAGGAAEPITLSYPEYEELKTLARERDDYLRRLQRAVADYQNLQKRIDKFREAARQEVFRSLAETILPMADSLGLALQAALQSEGAEDIVEGLRLVEKDFYGALAKFGIRPVEAVGQRFDPHYHEAVMQEEVAGAPPNTVVRELTKGFTVGEQTIRPSQVVVTPHAPSQTGTPGPGEPAEEGQ